MATDKRTIEVILTAKDSGYSSTMDKASSSTKKTSEEVKKLPLATKVAQGQLSTAAKGMAVFGGAMLAGVGLAVKAAAGFDQEMSRAFAATRGTADHTAEMFDEMKQKAIEASQALPVYSAQESASALTELIKAGRPAKDALNDLGPAMNMAAADGMDLADATSIMASTMTVFGKTGVTAANVSDTLAAGAGLAQGGIHDLGEALKYVGPRAVNANMSLKETTGLLGSLANNGVLGSMAGTSLSGVLRNLQTPTAEGAKQLEELNIQAYDLATGQFRGITPIIEDLGAALEGMSQEQQDKILDNVFDTRSLGAAIPLLNESKRMIDGNTNALRDMQNQVGQSGYAADQARDMMDNLSGDWTKFTNTMNIAMVKSADGTTSLARTGVQMATGMFNAYNALPPVFKNITMTATGAIGGVGVIGAGLIKGVEGAKKLRDSIQVLGMSAKNATKLVKGIGIAGGAISVGLAAGLAIFGYFSQKAQESADRVKDIAASMAVVNGQVQMTSGTAETLLAKFGEINDSWIDAGVYQGNLNQLFKDLDFSQADAVKAMMGSEEEWNTYLDSLHGKIVQWGRDNGQNGMDWFFGKEDTWAQGQFTQTEAQLKRLREETQRAAEDTKKLAEETNSLGTEYPTLEAAQTAAAGTTDALAQAGGALGKGTAAYTEELQKQQEAIKAAITDMFALRDAYASSVASESSYESAVDNAASAIDKKTAAQLKHKNITNLDNAATRQANDALMGIANQSKAYAATMVEQGSTQEAATAQMEASAAAIMAQGTKWGLSEKKLLSFTAAATDIPKSRITELTVKGTKTALAQIKAVEKQLKGVDKDQVVSISAAVKTGDIKKVQEAMKGVPAEQQLDVLATLKDKGFKDADKALDNLNKSFAKQFGIKVDGRKAKDIAKDVKTEIDKIHDKHATIYVNNVQTTIKKAKGGPIFGPGTGTSDSVPAMLSNGEHVLTAAEVQAMGGQGAVYRMRGLARAGMLKFASGGAVMPTYSGKPLDYWEDKLLSPLELTRLQIRIRDLNKDLAAKGRNRLRGLDRTAATQELAEAKKDLADAKTAAKLNKSAKGTIEQQIAKWEADQDAAAKAAGRNDLADQMATDLRRGTLMDSVKSGSGLSVVDQMIQWSKDENLSSTKRSGLASAAKTFEKQLTAAYDKLESATKTASELQSIYDQVASSLNNFDLAGQMQESWTTIVDEKGNVRNVLDQVTGASLASAATSQASTLMTFASKLSQLQGAGASPALMAKISALDPAKGIEVCDAFLADRGSLTQMNQALTNIETYSGAAAQAVTAASYKGGLAAAQGVVDKLNQDIAGIGTQMANAFASALGLTTAGLTKRAGGGPVYAGTPYLVGERGPELMVPRTSGTIIPNSVMPGTTNVTNINYVLDGITISTGESADTKTLTDFVKLAGRYRKSGVRR